MGKHHQPGDSAPVRTRATVRTTVLALAGLTVFVIAMVASYSGAFARPTLHHMTMAVAAPQPVIDGLRGQDALAVTPVADAAAARARVFDRTADAALAASPDGRLTIYVAGGGGHSVAVAAQTVGNATAQRAGLTPVVEDVAPTSAGDPSGTVEFYAVIFVSIGASLGAALLHRLMGAVRTPLTFAMRTASLATFSAVLAGAVTVYVGPVLDALTGHPAQVFGVLWLYSMAVAGAVTGVAAAFGTATSVTLGLFLVVVGNAAAAGPVGRPLLSGFYATFSSIVPQGSGVSLLRSISYFDGHGAAAPLITLGVWAGAGCLLAVLATAVRLNYRPLYERALLRSRLLSAAD